MAILVEHSKDWSKLYRAEAKRIKKAFGLKCYNTHHIGSTAIKDMPARPVIDILVALYEKADVRKLAELGYTDAGNHTYTMHTDNTDYCVHVVTYKYKDGSNIIPHLALTMYLSENKEAAAAFAQKKREIAAEFEHDIDAYQAAKQQMIVEIRPTALAHKQQRDKAAAYLPIGMCLGMSIGMCFGVALDNIALGMCIGMGVGTCLGLALGRINENKCDK